MFARSSLLLPLCCLVSPALLCAQAGGPSAGTPRERPRLVLQALDTNHDGQIQPGELQNATAALLTLDRNGDGELTPDELEPPRTDAGSSPDQLVAQLMALDRNGDGVLTPDELPERLQPMFARADANHDGKLTPDEIRKSAARSGSPNGRRGGPGSAAGILRLDPLLAALDANHDGIISTAEIANAPTALLALDANRDGTLETAEIRMRQQTPEERTNHLLDEWDTDKDGKLSREEVPDGLRARFVDADKNGDGFLDRAEILQMYSTAPAASAAPPALASPADTPTQPKGQHD